jgi:hypothetical protein
VLKGSARAALHPAPRRTREQPYQGAEEKGIGRRPLPPTIPPFGPGECVKEQIPAHHPAGELVTGFMTTKSPDIVTPPSPPNGRAARPVGGWEKWKTCSPATTSASEGPGPAEQDLTGIASRSPKSLRRDLPPLDAIRRISPPFRPFSGIPAGLSVPTPSPSGGDAGQVSQVRRPHP